MNLLSFKDDRDIDVFNRIKKIMQKLSVEGVFAGTEIRLALSCPTILICEDDKDIGFIYFVEENYGRVLWQSRATFSSGKY